MAGEPSTQNTIDKFMSEQEAMSLPRRRLTMDLNGQNRISLFSSTPKKVPEKKNENPTRGVEYDPFDFVDSSFEVPPARRRTVQLNEIMSKEPNRDMDDADKRRVVAVEEDEYRQNRKKPRLHESMDYENLEQPYTHASWEEKERMYIREKISMEETIKLLKKNLEDKTRQCESLKNSDARLRDSLGNYIEWADNQEKAYLALREQVEEHISKEQQEMPAIISSDQEGISELRELVGKLKRELEEKKSESRIRHDIQPTTQNNPRLIYDLYEDLTGVIVRDVKRGEEGTVYKCIIAGKTASFTFTLQVSKEKNGTAFYSPNLDRQRDAKLLTELPEFLKEDVEFERDNLPTFFWRLSQILN